MKEDGLRTRIVYVLYVGVLFVRKLTEGLRHMILGCDIDIDGT